MKFANWLVEILCWELKGNVWSDAVPVTTDGFSGTRESLNTSHVFKPPNKDHSCYWAQYSRTHTQHTYAKVSASWNLSILVGLGSVSHLFTH